MTKVAKKTVKKTTKRIEKEVKALPIEEEQEYIPDPERYAFEWPVRCPRCGTFNNGHRSTQSLIQYRKCFNPVCGVTFKVVGKKV